MTDTDTLKRAAELLCSLDHVEIDAADLESLAERMGQEPVIEVIAMAGSYATGGYCADVYTSHRLRQGQRLYAAPSAASSEREPDHD